MGILSLTTACADADRRGQLRPGVEGRSRRHLRLSGNAPGGRQERQRRRRSQGEAGDPARDEDHAAVGSPSQRRRHPRMLHSTRSLITSIRAKVYSRFSIDPDLDHDPIVSPIA